MSLLLTSLLSLFCAFVFQILAAASRVAASLGDDPSPSSFAEMEDLPSNSFTLSSEISCTTSSSSLSPSDRDVDSDRSLSSDSPRDLEGEDGPPSSPSLRLEAGGPSASSPPPDLHLPGEGNGACVGQEASEEAEPPSQTRQGKAKNIEGVVDERSGQKAPGTMASMTPSAKKSVQNRKTREKEERGERSKKEHEKREKDKKISTSTSPGERRQKDAQPSSFFVPRSWSRAHSHISQGLSGYWNGMGISEKSLSKAFDALLGGGGGGREYRKSSPATGRSSTKMDSNRKVQGERSSSSPLREAPKKNNGVRGDADPPTRPCCISSSSPPDQQGGGG